MAENIARCACITIVVLPLGVGRCELRTRAAPRRHVHQLRRGAASPPTHRRGPALCCRAHLDYGAHPQRACKLTRNRRKLQHPWSVVDNRNGAESVRRSGNFNESRRVIEFYKQHR